MCPRRPAAAGATGSGWPRPTRRWRCARPATTGRLLAWLYGPDERSDPAGRRRTSTSPPSRSSRSPGSCWPRRDGGAAGPGPSQDRHRAVPQRRRRRGLAASCAPRRPRPRTLGAVEVVGVWSHLAAADEPGAPSVPMQLAAFEAAYAGRAGRPGWSRRCATWPTRPARCCCRRPGWTWCGSASPRTGSTRRPAVAAAGRRPAPAGDAAARPAGERQDHRRRDRVSRTGSPGTRRAADHGSAWSRSATATASRGTPATAPRSAGPAGGRRSAVGSAWTSSWSSSATDASGPSRARRSCCSAPVIMASRPRRTGPTWCGTIGYEIVTRIGARVPRRFLERHRRSR